MSNIVKPQRKDGNLEIRKRISMLATGYLEQKRDPEVIDRVSLFMQPFKDLIDKPESHVVPNAVRGALKATFSSSNLLVVNEVPFYSSFDGEKPVKKVIDFVIAPLNQKSPTRLVAIELKTSIGFNELSAALLQFVLLTKFDNVILEKRKEFGPYRIDTCEVRCLIVSCNSLSSIEAPFALLTKYLDLQTSMGPVGHYRTFLSSGNSDLYRNTDAITKAGKSIASLIHEIESWCLPQD